MTQDQGHQLPAKTTSGTSYASAGAAGAVTVATPAAATTTALMTPSEFVDAGGAPGDFSAYLSLARTSNAALAGFPAEARAGVSTTFADLPPLVQVAVLTELAADAPGDAEAPDRAEVEQYAERDPEFKALARGWGIELSRAKLAFAEARLARMGDRLCAMGGDAAEARALMRWLNGLPSASRTAALARLSSHEGTR